MYGKLAVAAGFAAGYVLGSKAGRQRYEEIVAQARKVAGNETVQSTAGVLQAKGTDLVEKAKQSDIASKVKQTVGKDKDTTPAYGTEATYDSTTTDLFEDTTSTDPLVTDPLTTDPLRTNVNGTN
jgi:dihydroxyacetone kinase